MLCVCNKVVFLFCSEGVFVRKGGYFLLGEDDVMYVFDDVNCIGIENLLCSVYIDVCSILIVVILMM